MSQSSTELPSATTTRTYTLNRGKKNVLLNEVARNRAYDRSAFKLPDQTSKVPLNHVVKGRKPAANLKTLTIDDLDDLIGPRPDLPYTDTQLEERFKALKRATWLWATDYFSDTGPNASVIVDLVQLSQDYPELAEYINYLASCPQEETWEQFVKSRRTYLAFAVLGKVLEVHVFGQEMFGASEAQLKALRSLDLEMIHLNGFLRQAARAPIINSFLSSHNKALPPNFLSALTELQARIATLVSPLQQVPSPPSPFHQSLAYILFTAAQLSLDLRREPSTIYYMQPVVKVTIVDSATTHALNADELTYYSQRRQYHDQPIVRIAAWPIVEAYRLGKGQRHNSSDDDDDDDDGGRSGDGDDEDGIIVRRICTGEAYAEWGVLAPVRRRAHDRDRNRNHDPQSPNQITTIEMPENTTLDTPSPSTGRPSLLTELAWRRDILDHRQRNHRRHVMAYWAVGLAVLLLSLLLLGATGASPATLGRNWRLVRGF